ncbi:MAG TPA: DnaB-like helicase N-terminal domain-containing protein, partial [Bacillota bacterium]|nr:DnaB-like helicase N-terminal domain-containing protein [Bacillota bacterium]
MPAQEIQANLDAEQALLGSMLLDAGVADSVIARIKEDAFYSEPHRMVFKAIQAVRAQGGAVDIVTIVEALRQAGTLELVGGATYISVLGNSVPNVEHWEDHLKIVQEKATFRALKAEALRLQELADAGDIHKALEAIERAQAEAAAMIEGGRDRARVVNLAGVEAQETRWLWRPYIPLDCITILEGDPKTGKTWAALAITA